MDANKGKAVKQSLAEPIPGAGGPQPKSLLAESLSRTPQTNHAKKLSYGSFGRMQGSSLAVPPFRTGTPSPPRSTVSVLGQSHPRSIPKSRIGSLEPDSALNMSRPGSSMGRVRTSFGTPRSNHSSPSRRGSPSRRPPGDGESEPDVDVEDDYAQLTEKEIAKRVSEHLILPDAANEGHLLGSSQGSFGSVAHNLLGGEVTRDIYQWSEKRENPIHRRRNSEPDVRPGEPSRDDDVFTASDLREPGVFRRHFVQRQAIMAGREPNNPVTRNFLDFLALYGFYGGDVYPEDADDDEDDGFFNENEEDGETRPLVRSRTPSVAAIQGTSAKKAFFMVLKAFVGTGVLFLPKAFANGGMLFSLVTLGIIGFLTLHCMLLLVQTSRELGGSFGDIGEHLYGQKMRQLVLGSIAVSQAGFCCAYYIFIAQNLRDFVMTVSDCKWILPDWVFIVIQLVVYIPLSWVRKIKHFSITSLVADVFILLGLAYVLYFDIFIVATEGPARDFVWFNNQSFPLFVGTAMFAFEGICLILPIGESMKHPEQFGKVLSWCTVVIGVIFVSVGSMGYLTFGPKVETVVFLNLPRGPNTQIIQFLYALAIMLSFPLTVYPTIRITEHGLFGMLDGKHSNLVKWQKNLYRVALVACLGVVAWAGSNNLDKFVSLVGCFACIPLSFIYPSLFHSHIATNRWVRMKDMALVVFGIVAMLYTTSITLQEWYGGKPDLPVDRCTV